MAAVRRSSTTLGQPSPADASLAPNDRSRSGGPASSTTSIASSDNMADARRSTDGAFDRLRTRTSEDGRSDTSSSHRRRMSRIFRGRRKGKKDGHDDVDDADMHRAPPLPGVRHSSTEPLNHSDDSLGLYKSTPSSLLTDSDTEAPPVRQQRPGISPHQSHAGLLTLSSPLIASETIDSADVTLVDSTSSVHDASLPSSTTLDTTASPRAVSPVSKLKEAFTHIKTPASPSKEGDTDTAKPGAIGGGFGALFGGKKREQRAWEESHHASPPQIHIHTGSDTQSTTSLRSTGPRRIITQIPATPPNLVGPPTTFVTPPTPVDPKPSSPTESTRSGKWSKHSPSQSASSITASPSGNMISHRRVRSATNPSKLSNSTTAPLTPHIEEAKTPGGTAVPSSSSGGFFSSVFSAAQNAATTIGKSITDNTVTKSKLGQSLQKEEDQEPEDGGEEVIGPENLQAPTSDGGAEKPRPAVETLGSGNLSLAHLGIADSTDVSPMSSSTNITMKADEASAKVEDNAAAQAVSAAYAEKPPSINNDRPRSNGAVSGSNGAGAATPPRYTETVDSPEPSSVRRNGSIRSRISDGRKRRHRGSSAATGTSAIGAIIGASTSTLVPGAALNGQRLNGTGFAVASPKRNRDFHNLFKSVPEDDYLIEDYSAALQKEILLHGRIYVSEGHLCFSSNILGWVTNLVISFDEVVSVEKKSTAVLFPNAIVIQTLHARNIFASFLARDSTYDLIIGIWKISHPNLKSSLNGVTLDGSATGDKTEKAESVGSDQESSQDSDDDVYDEDAEEDDGTGSFTEAGEGSVAGSEMASVAVVEARKASAAISQAVGGGGETTEAAASSATSTNDFPGTATHAPTECGDTDQHYDKLLIDTTIPAPLGKVYSLMFGPASGAFMRKWLIEDQKSLDLQMEDDKKGLGEGRKTYNYSYIKPLSAPVGPRQTKCNITMTLEQYDLNKAASVLCSTQTPDVPSGNIFLTKTRYCLMWGPGNSTRLIMTFTVEWSGKSWLRGPIEKGANDGQMSYATAITAALRAAVVTKLTPAKVPGGKGVRGKKRSKSRTLDSAPAILSNPVPSNQPKQPNWGIFDPLRGILGPVADIIESLISPQIIIFILGTLLIYTWFFRGAATSTGPNQWSTAQRQVAHEEIWRSEESELWKWLEDRVAMDRVVHANHHHGYGGELVHLKPETMQERDIDEAIRITEQRLGELRDAVERQREKTRSGSKNKKTKSKSVEEVV